MKAGDVVRLRKSHPAVKRWRKGYRSNGHPEIGKWAEEGESLLHLGVCDYAPDRVKVLGPGGELASFDDFLLITQSAK